MAEIIFFATDDDHALLVEALIAEFQARFVIDHGTSLPLQTLGSCAEVMAHLRGSEYGARFALLSPRWQQEPLVTSCVKGADGVERHYVKARDGGPSLDFVAKREESSGAGRYVIPSSFGSFPSYYLQQGEVRAPEPLRQAMGWLRRFVRRGGAPTVVGGSGRPGPVAMRNALERLERGTWLRVGESHYERKPRT